MSKPDEKLVQQIAEQVLKAMRGEALPGGREAPGEAEGTQPESRTAPPAPIRAPAGVCTGDYSKFTELMGKPVGARKREAIGGAAEEAAPNQKSEIRNQTPSTALSRPSSCRRRWTRRPMAWRTWRRRRG